jgi:malonate-semialdehyde dehydrogenase (acetylating)/methylmalonate-semialdehyde dehydrogenase
MTDVLTPAQRIAVVDPATTQTLGHVALASREDCTRAVAAADGAFASWSAVPVVERARLMMRYADALERRHEDLATSVSRENGKTIADARAEVRRGIEAVEFACGMPSLMMGDALPDVARGVDSYSFRKPLGVCIGITPFNFPAMIPLWMFPLALAAGNTFVLKPSPQTPLTSDMLAEIARECRFPDGILNVVHGEVAAVEALIEDPRVQAVSFVGSSAVARVIQERAVASHKRVQALGGAKNFLVVMPDGVTQPTIDAIMSSAFGGAGQRCLAGSVAIAVGNAADALVPKIVEAAKALRLGPGVDPGVDMGPVISAASRERVAKYVERAVAAGARLLLDGREAPRTGSFVAPTVFDVSDTASELVTDEIFGPVLAIVRARTLDDAIGLANSSRYGNASSIFTGDGGAAREFASRIETGMIGVNIGVAAPMAFFPFGGIKDSIYGDLRCHGKDAVAFYTQQRVVISRWPG